MVSHVCIQKESESQVMRTFELHVFPTIGKFPVHQLTLHNWLTVLDRLLSGIRKPPAELSVTAASAIHGQLNASYLRATHYLRCLALALRNRWESGRCTGNNWRYSGAPLMILASLSETSPSTNCRFSGLAG